MYRLAKVLLLLGWVLMMCNSSAQAQTVALFKTDDLGKQQVFDSFSRTAKQYNEKDTIISNKHIAEAKQRFSDFDGRPIVSIVLNDEGTERFEQATKVSIGKPILILLDGKLISAPVVQTEIAEGRIEIAGGFTIEEAKQLAKALNVGNQIRKKGISEKLIVATIAFENALIDSNFETLDSLLDDNLIMGHSNAYMQSKADVFDDLKGKKITYESFKQIGDFEIDIFQSSIRLNRKVAVVGKYMGEKFEMKLAVMEIWKDTKQGLKLWSRQAVKIKD